MFLFFLLLISAFSTYAQQKDLSPVQRSAWSAVKERWQAWQDNDLDAYMSKHHSTWHRWALRTKDLEDRDDIRSFWKSVKKSEETVGFELESPVIEIYNDGKLAAVHYIADETIRLLQKRTTRDGRSLPIGHESHIRIRFSDFLVLEDEKWNLIGGYRDGNCALFRGFGTLCKE